MGFSGQYMECNWTSFKITSLLFTDTCRKCAAEVRVGNSKPKRSLSPETKKIQNGHQAAILKVTFLKINWHLSIHTSNVLLKFGLDIQSQTEVRVRKPKNPRWPPGGHFEIDIAENQQASAHCHQQDAYGISNWNSKANSTETMSSTDGRTDWQGDSSIPTTNFVGWGY